MEKNQVEMCDKIQILTRAISIATIKNAPVIGTMDSTTYVRSVDHVVQNYKKLLEALTEEPSE